MVELLVDLVSKKYERKRWALQKISLRLQDGVIGLVGPNGSGKTTLLRIIATLLTPTQGVVAWNGNNIVRNPYAVRHELGYLPQKFGAYPQLNAVEFLHYIGELKGLAGSKLRSRVDEVLEMTHLTDDAQRRLGSFSGGMLQRVGIAQSLLNEPRLLLLDEPTVGLDPAERIYFREMIASLQRECLVILSSHIISDIEAMATELILLKQGQLCWTGTVSGLLADADHSTWEMTIDSITFEKLRATYQVSAAIRRGNLLEVRLVASERPYPQATSVTPSLEEAYLFCTGLSNESKSAIIV